MSKIKKAVGSQKASGRNPNEKFLNVNFAGSYRKSAKTTLAKGPTKNFANIEALRKVLPTDATMRSKYPHIRDPQKTPKGRLQEEQLNVQVNAWIFAVKLEMETNGDGDFHVIMGSSPTLNEDKLMNVEISALNPSSPDKDALLTARKQFIDLFADTQLGTSYDKFFSNPRKVRVKGSVFFDGDHNPNTIGPTGAKPQTVWEIHPVIAIKALG